MADGLPGGLWQAAAEVLAGNDAGRWTVPSRQQYPHQWNWDSALISLGWSRINQDRAEVEIESILDAQWDDGMVPHVRYDPRRLRAYFPGPDCWPHAPAHLPAGIRSSGISNPPVAATAARLVGERQQNSERRREFWARVLPGLSRWLQFFGRHRRLDGCPLVVVVHPWETGWDNSPRWDLLRSARLRPRSAFARRDRQHVRSSERPEDRDYDAYLALVELLDGSGYSLPGYRAATPFLVYDVFFDAAWYRAATDLNAIALQLGRPPPFDSQELEEFAAAFEDRHWDAEARDYLDYDLVNDRRIRVGTPAGLAAGFSGLIPADRLRVMWDRYMAAGPGLHPVWTLSPRSREFEPERYWRGPVWMHVNWLVAEGLDRCGLHHEASRLRASSLELVAGAGFREHYSPFDGSGGGAQSFSWSAALTLEFRAGTLAPPRPQSRR